MKATIIISIAVAAVGLACSSTKSGPSGSSTTDLRTCVVDVWLDTSHACSCVGAFKTPECAAQDCLEANALVLAADGTSADLILRRSETLATFSAVGGSAAVINGHWSLAPSTTKLSQTFDATKSTFDTEVQCSGTRLVRVGKAGYDRASTRLGPAVFAAKTGNTWTGISFR